MHALNHITIRSSLLLGDTRTHTTSTRTHFIHTHIHSIRGDLVLQVLIRPALTFTFDVATPTFQGVSGESEANDVVLRGNERL